MKSIEEAAIIYATEVDKNAVELYGIDNPPMSLTFGECAAEAFRAGANHIMSLPLAERITVEELEAIIKLHIAATSGTSEFGRGYSAALERIFGTELFAEKRGKL